MASRLLKKLEKNQAKNIAGRLSEKNPRQTLGDFQELKQLEKKVTDPTTSPLIEHYNF